MLNKNNLHKRILTIYIVYFFILLAGLVYNVAPDFIKGYRDGYHSSEKVAQSLRSGQPLTIIKFFDIPAKNFSIPIQNTYADGTLITGSITVNSFDVEMQSHSKDLQNMSPYKSIRQTVAGMGLIILLGLGAIFILIFVIINSLRRSIRNDMKIDKKNILYTRLVGGLIIVIELLNALTIYLLSNRMSQFLTGSTIQVNTDFFVNVSFWNILMGLLVLFTAEILTIGTQLSEEQEYTI